MSVVLIAYHFPPDPAVGSLRAAKVARAFRDAGHRVDVITVARADEASPRPSDDEGLVVHPVVPLPTPRELYARAKVAFARRRRAARHVAGADSSAWTPPTHVAGWKRFLFSLLWVPDDRQGFIVPAWRKAHDLVRRGARLVYTTAPPYSPHLVGLALRSLHDVRWVMELRDPWADNRQKPWWIRSRATDALDAALERRCLRRADLVVTASEGIRMRLAARWPGRDASGPLLVRNGIGSLKTAHCTVRRPGPVRIVYAGTFYYGRDPRLFLRALAATCRKYGLGPDRVRVDFVGACRTLGTVSVENEIGVLGLGDIVRVHDWLPHADATRLVDDADVLLLLAQEQPDQVPNKLYEYLGSRRRILAFADRDGETARMLRQVGGHLVVAGADEPDAVRALEEALVTAPSRESVGNESILKEWTTEVQMRRLLAAVNG
jgi:glycosyltransferase involved in cell wall biosynthesis